MSEPSDIQEATEPEGDEEYEAYIGAPLVPDYLEAVAAAGAPAGTMGEAV